MLLPPLLYLQQSRLMPEGPFKKVHEDIAKEEVTHFGVTDYTNIIIDVKSENFSFYVLNGETPEVVLQKYTDLTGKPFHIPEWALEHQISKYSYYPEERVEEVVENYQKASGLITGVPNFSDSTHFQ